MAAGKGTRMKSARPKVLHRLGGTSLLQHVLNTCVPLQAARTIVITGHAADEVEASAADQGLAFVRQVPQLGTGHAIQQAVPALDDGASTTLILNGDVPLIRAATAAALARACGGEQLALLTIELADATGYGRILRDASGRVTGIVEHKDANPAQRAICEIYTGMMAAPTAALKRWVAALKNDNAQREYYLTDIVAMAVAEGVPVVATQPESETEVLGVNSPVQLADLERRYQRAGAEALMEAGDRSGRFYLLTAGQAAYRDRGVQFVEIVFQDSVDAANRFLDELGRGEGYLYVLDPGSRAAVEFGVYGVPETFFVDREGRIVDKIAGPIDPAGLAAVLEAILAGGGD